MIITELSEWLKDEIKEYINERIEIVTSYTERRIFKINTPSGLKECAMIEYYDGNDFVKLWFWETCAVKNNTVYIAVDGSDQYQTAYNPGTSIANGNLLIQKLQIYTDRSFELNTLHAAMFRKLINQIKRSNG